MITEYHILVLHFSDGYSGLSEGSMFDILSWSFEVFSAQPGAETRDLRVTFHYLTFSVGEGSPGC